MAEKQQTTFARQIEHVGHTGIYPVSGPLPPGDAEVRGQGELGHPEEHRAIRSTVIEQTQRRAALMAGRAIFGGFFLYSGLNHFISNEMMTGYARSKGVPKPELAVATSGTMFLLGGLSLLTGIRPKVGAALIAAGLAGVTTMHDFWNVEGDQRMQELVNFTKNVALIGGAALAAAIPEPWPASMPLRRAPL